MKTRIRNFIDNIKENDKVKIDQKLLIFLFFLVVSTIFWFLSALNKEYVTVISYPVDYQNFPMEKGLTGELPDHLKIKIRAYGFTILQHKLDPTTYPVPIDVNNLILPIPDQIDTSDYFILTNTAWRRISDKLGDDIKILEISPDSIHLVFDDIRHKKVPVKPVLSLKYEKQYIKNGKITISPDSVTVSGSETLIDTLQAVYTHEIKAENLVETLQVDAVLHSIPGLTFSDEHVQLVVPVERFTEAEYKIPIEVINLPRNTVLKIFPDKVKINYLVTLGEYDNVIKNQFGAIVDYRSIQNNPSKRLKVKVLKSPSNIISFQYYPRDVEFIIEKQPSD